MSKFQEIMTGSANVTPEPPEDATPGWKSDPSGGSQFRYWDGTSWTDRTENPDGTPPAPARKDPLKFKELLPALILTAIAATLILAGQLTPMYESVSYREILQNTLIQQDIGWILVAGSGILLLIALFAKRPVAVAWAGILVGLIAVGVAGVAGLDESMRTLESAAPGARRGSEEVAVAATGVYLTAIGGMAAIAAGAAALWLDAGRKA